MATNVQIYKSCIMAILLYGSETWTVTKAYSCRLQDLQMFDMHQRLHLFHHGSGRHGYYLTSQRPQISGPRRKARTYGFCKGVAGPCGKDKEWSPSQPRMASPGVVHGAVGWTTLKKTSLLLSTPRCDWLLIDKLGEVSVTVLRRPRIHYDDVGFCIFCFSVFFMKSINL